MAKKKQSKSKQVQKARVKRSTTDEMLSYLKSLAIAFLMVLPLKHFVVEGYRVPTGSMENTIMVGDFLLANKFIYGATIPFTDTRLPAVRDPKPGDVVIFKFPLDPSLNYVKRCIACPGQTVEVKDKVVYVDGKRFQDDKFTKYTDKSVPVKGSQAYQRDNFGPYTVPKDEFFMMGDNRDHSYDSRFWGCVPRRNILGKALFLYLSWGEDSHAPHISMADPFSLVHSLFYNFIHFYQRMRWNRLGMPVV
jgi:signal peptidase I